MWNNSEVNLKGIWKEFEKLKASKQTEGSFENNVLTEANWSKFLCKLAVIVFSKSNFNEAKFEDYPLVRKFDNLLDNFILGYSHQVWRSVVNC